MSLGGWYLQKVSENTFLGMRIRSIVFSGRTKYQHVEIVVFEDYGTGLVLDGLVQSTEADEYLYHESLVHPAMILHNDPKNILIIGGGEGATLREVLKHNTVKHVVMVDIDGELVDLAKKYLGSIHQGSFYDPRAEIVIEDGYKYVMRTSDKSFDVVIMDLTDPYDPHGPARELYTEKFFGEIKRILKEDGVLVSQIGNAFYYEDIYNKIIEDSKRVFRYVKEYSVWIPSFGYEVCFMLATDHTNPDKLSDEDLDKIIRKRNVSTRYINGIKIKAMFNLGVRKKLRHG